MPIEYIVIKERGVKGADAPFWRSKSYVIR